MVTVRRNERRQRIVGRAVSVIKHRVHLLLRISGFGFFLAAAARKNDAQIGIQHLNVTAQGLNGFIGNLFPIVPDQMAGFHHGQRLVQVLVPRIIHAFVHHETNDAENDGKKDVVKH